MLFFAYDGSLNGDWVAHYAVRFAAATATRHLTLLHVKEAQGGIDPAARIARIAEECALLGVTFDTETLACAGRSVSERLLERVAPHADAVLIAGTRGRPRNLAFLADSVASRLLAGARCMVVAIRVVHPGVLGQPGRVLLPVTGAPADAGRAARMLRLLGPDLRELQVLLVHELSRLRFRLLRAATARALLEQGHARVAHIESELRHALAGHDYAFDSRVVVCDDAAKEALVYAGRLHARLICLDAAAHGLPRRFYFSHPIEQVLRNALCDVAVYRSIE